MRINNNHYKRKIFCFITHYALRVCRWQLSTFRTTVGQINLLQLSTKTALQNIVLWLDLGTYLCWQTKTTTDRFCL